MYIYISFSFYFHGCCNNKQKKRKMWRIKTFLLFFPPRLVRLFARAAARLQRSDKQETKTKTKTNAAIRICIVEFFTHFRNDNIVGLKNLNFEGAIHLLKVKLWTKKGIEKGNWKRKKVCLIVVFVFHRRRRRRHHHCSCCGGFAIL